MCAYVHKTYAEMYIFASLKKKIVTKWKCPKFQRIMEK